MAKITAVANGDTGLQARTKLNNALASADLTSEVTGVLPVANGGTNANTEAGARTSLGLAIGTDVQAWDADLDTWATKTAPTGAAVGTTDTQTLTNKTLTDAKLTSAINTQTGTTYTIALTDASKIVEMNNAGTNTLTIPANASVAFPIGTTLTIVQYGAGATTVQGDTGVTVNGISAGSVAASAQYEGFALYKRATDEWILTSKTVA